MQCLTLQFLSQKAQQYADLISRIIIKHPHHFNSTLTKNIKEVSNVDDFSILAKVYC